VLQVPRYKALLLKQRDIMIALTERLQERDERILALQDDLDASDAVAKCAFTFSLSGCCYRQRLLWFLSRAAHGTLPGCRLEDELDQRSAKVLQQ